METPVAFPLSDSRPRVFIINDTDGTVRAKASPSSSSSSYDTKRVGFSLAAAANGATGASRNTTTSSNPRYDRGAASVSFVTVSNDRVVVTTSPVVNESNHTVAVSLFSTTRQQQQPVSIIHLDLGSETQNYQNTVKAQAFAVLSSNINVIQLTCIDTNGSVISVNLSAMDLEPIAVERCLSIGTDVLDPAIRKAVASYALRSSMIHFLSESAIVISLNPFLFGIDLDRRTAVQWSKTVCLEEMRLRQRSSGFVGSIVGLLTGSSSSTTTLSTVSSSNRKHVLLDMNPVSAVVAADNDPTQIFTLHSDGSVRRWVIQNQVHPAKDDGGDDEPTQLSRLKPYEVYDLHIYPPSNAEHIPSPQLWSDDVNSMFMTARMYDHDKLFVLAIYIQTSDAGASSTAGTNHWITSSDNHSVASGDSSEMADATEYEDFGMSEYNRRKNVNNCHLIVMDGIVEGTHDDAADVTKVHCIALQIPPNVSALIGMSFDSQQDRCMIKALFQNHPTTSPPALASSTTKVGSILVTYPPSNLSIVYREPQVCESYGLLNSIALEEYERINGLGFYNFVRNNMEANDKIDDLLHEIDRRYLQYLFRPTFPRGNGTVLPPCSYLIRQALHRRGGRRSVSASGSLELQVIRTMQEWREGDVRRQQKSHHRYNNKSTNIVRFAMTPTQPSRQPETRALVATPAGKFSKSFAATPYKSIYDALQLNDDDDDDNLGATNLTYGAEPVTTLATVDDADSPMQVDDEATDGAIGRGDMIKECKLHEDRWRQLLFDIWEGEERERSPLCLFIPPKSTLEDSIVIVRSGCISIVGTEKPFTTGAGFESGNDSNYFSALDSLATKLLQVFEKSEQDCHLVKLAECFAWEYLSEGRIAIDSMAASNIKSKLHHSANDALMTILDQDDCRKDIDELESLSEKEILRQLLYEPFNSTIPGLSVLSHMQSDAHVDPECVLDYQIRLAASGLVTRTMQSLRQLFLARFLILSEVVEKSEGVVSTALRMYLHVTNVLWAAAQVVPLPKPSDGNTSRYFGEAASPPPTKRTSLGSGVTSLLAGQSDKTTVLDCRLIQLAKVVGTSHFSRSLATLPISLARVGIMASLQFAVTSTDQAISHEKLPELGILALTTGVSNDHAGLVTRLLAPSVAFPDPTETSHIVAVREELMAESLLQMSQNEASDRVAKSMILKSFELLNFDEYDLQNAMHRIETLNRHSAKNRRVAPWFSEFVANAIAKLDSRPEGAFPRSGSLTQFSILWTIRFNTALTICNWDAAYDACINNPKDEEKSSNSRRLVVAMVDAGALPELSCLCSQSYSGDEFARSFQKVGYLYGIAVEELTEMSKRDLYTQLAVESEPPSDYNGALYYLFAETNHWKDAAQALDLRYVNAMKCLSRDNADLGLTQEDMIRRDQAIVDDLAHAAIGCYNALLRVGKESERFLVSGESRPLPSIPIKIAHASLSKRGRGNDPRNWHRPASQASTSLHRLERFMTMIDIQARAVRCAALKVLFHDAMCGTEFVKSALLNEKVDRTSDQVIIGKLFELGYYQDGLTLAKVSSIQIMGKPSGYDAFYNELCRLLIDYLIPVAMVDDYDLPRPTLCQLNAGVDAIAGNVVLLLDSRHKKVKNIHRSETRMSAMHLLEKLVARYVSAEILIAKDVAESIILNQRTLGPLPSWLERILLEGTSTSTPPSILPGLFARRRSEGTHGYLGDPSFLLDLYVVRGLYVDACRVVCAVLNDGNRGGNAPSRLPEKGDIDFVPYHTIDELWCLMDGRIKGGDAGNGRKKKMESARKEMESSLEHHFKLLKVSNEGLKSARALA